MVTVEVKRSPSVDSLQPVTVPGSGLVADPLWEREATGAQALVEARDAQRAERERADQRARDRMGWERQPTGAEELRAARRQPPETPVSSPVHPPPQQAVWASPPPGSAPVEQSAKSVDAVAALIAGDRPQGDSLDASTSILRKTQNTDRMSASLRSAAGAVRFDPMTQVRQYARQLSRSSVGSEVSVPRQASDPTARSDGSPWSATWLQRLEGEALQAELLETQQCYGDGGDASSSETGSMGSSTQREASYRLNAAVTAAQEERGLRDRGKTEPQLRGLVVAADQARSRTAV